MEWSAQRTGRLANQNKTPFRTTIRRISTQCCSYYNTASAIFDQDSRYEELIRPSDRTVTVTDMFSGLFISQRKPKQGERNRLTWLFCPIIDQVSIFLQLIKNDLALKTLGITAHPVRSVRCILSAHGMFHWDPIQIKSSGEITCSEIRHKPGSSTWHQHDGRKILEHGPHHQ
jgi:hypothetical protein